MVGGFDTICCSIVKKRKKPICTISATYMIAQGGRVRQGVFPEFCGAEVEGLDSRTPDEGALHE